MPEFASISVKVHGRVQGVFFRSFVKQRARPLGLTGYVRNLPDGRTVEVCAEGDKEKLKQLIDQLWEGPPVSRVDDVKFEWMEYAGKFDDFKER